MRCSSQYKSVLWKNTSTTPQEETRKKINDCAKYVKYFLRADRLKQYYCCHPGKLKHVQLRIMYICDTHVVTSENSRYLGRAEYSLTRKWISPPKLITFLGFYLIKNISAIRYMFNVDSTNIPSCPRICPIHSWLWECSTVWPSQKLKQTGYKLCRLQLSGRN